MEAIAAEGEENGGKRGGGSLGRWLPLILAGAAPVPGVLLRLGLYHAPPPVEAFLYGLAILGAAFVLSWAADVAQLDMAQGLALAILALIAILPEYVVDATFA